MKTRVGEKGSGLPEVMATVGVIAVLMAVAATGLSRRHFDLEAAHQQLGNTVREMRLKATIKGAHFRLVPTESSYELRRLDDDDGDGLWEEDPGFDPQTFDLPPGVTLAANWRSGGETSLEFDTRGMAIDPLGGAAEVVHLTLTSAQEETRVVEVWPSGQVQIEPIAGVSP